MNEEDKYNVAFFVAFSEEMGQYDVSYKDFEEFLRGEDKYFDGYTQLADAYNLWRTAVEFGRNNPKQGE